MDDVAIDTSGIAPLGRFEDHGCHTEASVAGTVEARYWAITSESSEKNPEHPGLSERRSENLPRHILHAAQDEQA